MFILFKYSLLIQIKTWTRYNSDLYDYNSLDQKSSSFIVDKKGYLIRSKSDIAFIEYYGFNKYKESYNRFKICEIDYKNDNFYLKVEYQNDEVTYDIDDKVYILTNSINGLKINEDDYYGYELNEGDIIKIGRFKIKVRKIHLIDKKINNDDDNHSEKEDKKK